MSVGFVCRGSNLLLDDILVGNGPFCPFLDISIFDAVVGVCVCVCVCVSVCVCV